MGPFQGHLRPPPDHSGPCCRALLLPVQITRSSPCVFCSTFQFPFPGRNLNLARLRSHAYSLASKGPKGAVDAHFLSKAIVRGKALPPIILGFPINKRVFSSWKWGWSRGEEVKCVYQLFRVRDWNRKELEFR